MAGSRSLVSAPATGRMALGKRTRDDAIHLSWIWKSFRKLFGNWKENRCIFTLDLDVLDPSVFPGTGTPEPGGISFEELRRAVTQICSAAWIVGCDVNELSPALDASGASTAVACKIVREMLLGAVGKSKD